MNWKSSYNAVSWLGRHKGIVVMALIPIICVTFFVAEHMRGRISLTRYIHAASARGEKMSVGEFLSPLPPDENGAPEVLARVKELKAGVILPKDFPPRMRLTGSGHAVICFREEEWGDAKVSEPWEQLAADLETNKTTLEKIRTALAKPVLNCKFDPTLGPRARFPHLPVPKTLASWFGSRIAWELHEGRARDTVKDLVAEIELPRFLEPDGIVISELVRVAIGGVARSDTWEALQADGWEDSDLAQLEQAWERQHFADPMVRALEGERVFAQSSYELMRKSNEEAAGVLFWMDAFGSEEGRPNWEQTLRDFPGGKIAADFLKKQVYCRLWRYAWLEQDELHYLRYLEQFIALAREASQRKSLQKVEPGIDALVLKFQNRGFYDRLRYFSEMSVNSLSRILTRAMRAETERSLVLAAIAVKRNTVGHGCLPESLQAMVPEFFSSVPVDFMDGQPLRFRAEAEGGFLPYSVGEDGKDDGGDTSLCAGKTNGRIWWERKDVVWPAPATEAELKSYRAESGRN